MLTKHGSERSSTRTVHGKRRALRLHCQEMTPNHLATGYVITNTYHITNFIAYLSRHGLNLFHVLYQIKSGTTSDGMKQANRAVYGLWKPGQKRALSVVCLNGIVSYRRSGRRQGILLYAILYGIEHRTSKIQEGAYRDGKRDRNILQYHMACVQEYHSCTQAIHFL